MDPASHVDQPFMNIDYSDNHQMGHWIPNLLRTTVPKEFTSLNREKVFCSFQGIDFFFLSTVKAEPGIW